jgi:hypothetical protein
MLPGLNREDITIVRPTTAADAEGDYTNATTAIANLQGAWGSASSSEITGAAQRDETIDSVCLVPLGTDIKVEDRVTVVGKTWVVVGVKTLIPHLRCLLREV